MKIRINEARTYLRFRDKNVVGKVFYDGSGYLAVLDKNVMEWCREDATHGSRVSELKKLATLYTKAYRQASKVKWRKQLRRG
jgi:hypothetical protein